MEGSATIVDYRKPGDPCSKLSTGGPSQRTPNFADLFWGGVGVGVRRFESPNGSTLLVKCSCELFVIYGAWPALLTTPFAQWMGMGDVKRVLPGAGMGVRSRRPRLNAPHSLSLRTLRFLVLNHVTNSWVRFFGPVHSGSECASSRFSQAF